MNMTIVNWNYSPAYAATFCRYTTPVVTENSLMFVQC